MASRGRAPTRPADLAIEEVSTESGVETFVQFQLDHYRGDPRYVPPIVAERRDFLTPGKNPFLEHATIRLFLARRAGRVIGRIAAIDDPLFNQFHASQTGFFGMFECIEDPAVAGALLDCAGDWVRARGMKTLLGPMNLSTNHDCGLLVDGFEFPPAMMMPYNFAYYPALFTANRFKKAKDLYSYDLAASVAPPEKIVRAAEKVLAQDGVRVRPIDIRDLSAEKRRIKAIYDALLERMWGFVPLTSDEFNAIAERLKPLILARPELVLLAFVNDEPVGFALTLMDSNIALKAARGHLTRFGVPVGLARMLWAARNIERVRVLTVGVKPAFRRRGIDTALYLETIRRARQLGFSGGELGWVLEDDEPLIRAIEQLGARRYKTYRLYERALNAPARRLPAGK